MTNKFDINHLYFDFRLVDFSFSCHNDFKQFLSDDMIDINKYNLTKNINMKKGPSSVQTASPTKELRSKRVPSSIAVA